VRLFIIARHAQTLLNLQERVNGDWTLDVPLTEQGEVEARRLGSQVLLLPLDQCVHTRFPRTRRTAEVALMGRNVPFVEEPLLDDVYVGELDGRSLADYRAWKAEHTRSDPFPGGESLDDSARRYARAFRKLLAGATQSVLVVCHEIPLRYALNGASGSDELDGPARKMPNATPFLFDEHALERAAARIEELARQRQDAPVAPPARAAKEPSGGT
jgi:broad specificity phosphatase PhoE